MRQDSLVEPGNFGVNFLELLLFLAEWEVSEFTIVPGQGKVAQGVEILCMNALPIITEHLLPLRGKPFVLGHNMFNSQRLCVDPLLPLVLNGAEQILT